MTINNYFKTTEEINQLFQKAFDALEQQGYAATAILFEEAFRHDPYRLQAHYKLALYFASTQSADRFKEHFFICWNIDAAYKEKITTDAIVVNALGNELIAEIVAAKELNNRWCRRSFYAVDPSDNSIWLIFKPDQKKAIRHLYVSLDETTTNYFRKHKRNGEPPNIYEEYVEPDFDLLDYFELDHWSDRDAVDCSPEALYTALQHLSEYVDNNVRFLVTSEWDDFIDEVIILNGVFHVYRHQTGARDYYARLEFIETIINLYPDDGMLRSWLCKEYQTVILYRINYDTYDTIQFLDEAMRLSTPEDPWMPYVMAKIALSKADMKSALTYLKDAAAKTTSIFEIFHELGKLLVLHTNEYRESIHHLSVALGIKKYTDIYLHRALAYCKTGESINASKDIESYISDVEPHNNFMLQSAGYFLSKEGFNKEANTLFSAALEKNLLWDNEQLEKKKNAKSDSSVAFHDRELLHNANLRARIYTGLSITATSPEARFSYSSKALSLAETDPNLLYNMGVVLYDQGKITEAEEYYDRALALNGNLITALNNKSILRMQQKDYTTALQLTDQILKIDYNYAEAFSTKATIAYLTGDLPSALKYYEEYLTRNPSSGKGQYGVGFIYTHMRQDEKAIPYLLQAIELSAKNVQLNEMYSNLANCYNNTGRLSLGIEAAEKSIAVNPNYYHPYYILACIYKKEERDEEALEMVKKALSLAPLQRHQILNEPDLIKLKEKMQSL